MVPDTDFKILGLEAGVEWFQLWQRRQSEYWFGRKYQLDGALLIVLLVIFGYLLRWFVRFWRRGQLGTVEIESGTDSYSGLSQPDGLTNGLKALLRDTLENLGLDPPAPQPAASISTDIGTLITTSGISATGLLQAIKNILPFLRRMLLPTVGHKVSITLRTIDQRTEAVVEIKDAGTGKPKAIESVRADSAEAAVRLVGYHIYLYAMKQKYVLRHTPEWARFMTAENFELYQQGKQGIAAKPIEAYQKAANKELNNALIRLALAAAFVDSGHYLDGLEVYLHIVARWPELLEPRYRLAATLSFNEKLCEEWAKLDQERQVKLTRSLQYYVSNDGSTQKEAIEIRKKLANYISQDDSTRKQNSVEILKKGFLELAKYQWQYLKKQLYWRVRISQWLATFKPFDGRPDMRTYLGPLAGTWPKGLARRQLQRAVEIAECCTKIQLESCPQKATKIVEKVDKMLSPGLRYWRHLRWWGMTGQAHYNAACAYSIALQNVCKDVSCAKCRTDARQNVCKDVSCAKCRADKGIEELKHVIQDPNSTEIWRWLFDNDRGDPDLKTLRAREEFKVWEYQIFGCSGQGKKDM
jgi:hypothetical protein